MGNKVFANGREVSCKAAAGKTICAFPDTCFTPPQTPATPPGVPIPYPNTGKASDMSDGSKNVKITKKEVGLKNKSYFKSSMGDEAGSAPKKGVITSKNKGKVYFKAWSMDVKVEGKNVTRHLDITTNNHASETGDTPPWPYADSMTTPSKDPCKKEKDQEKKACNGCKTREEECNSKKCQKAQQCKFQPYSRSKNKGCCPGKTPHHLIPVHCFMGKGERNKSLSKQKKYKGCSKYNQNKAPCICVDGKTKTPGSLHGKLHKVFDKLEDNYLASTDPRKAGSWTYKQAKSAATKSAKKAGCSAKCTNAQLKHYHEDQAKIKPDTALRADSRGHGTTKTFKPSVTESNVI